MIEGAAAIDQPAAEARPRRSRLHSKRVKIFGAQVGLLIFILAFWQWVPTLSFAQHATKVLDPFYVSSPSRIISNLGELTGITSPPEGQLTPTIWEPLWSTLAATLWGSAAGVLLGLLLGVLLSESETTERIFRPFIVALNAIPRIAVIPIIIIILGPTVTAAGVSALIIVVFIVFYNAFAGGRSVRRNVIRNAVLLGCSRREIIYRIRLPYALAWTFAALPTAISFGLIGAVTAELFAGASGMGGLLQQATGTLNATLTMSIIVVLCVVGVLLVVLTTLVQRRVLHWWEGASS